MDAIVYTSNTGYTKKYALLLSSLINLPAYTIKESSTKLQPGSSIIYMGWLMASEVKDYKKVNKKYNVKALCGVGMGATGSQIEQVKERNKVSNSIEVFTLQGGFDLSKLKGVYRFMMKMMSKNILKELENKDLSEDEKRTYEILKNGKDYVSEEELKTFIDWYNNNK